MYRNNHTNRFLPRNGKDKYSSPTPQRKHTYMSPDDLASGKKSQWLELEITGPVCNLSPRLWQLRHLTSLYLNDNHLYCIPRGISQLACLTHLDLSSNNFRALPPEIGDLVMLRELLLNNNELRNLPFELGKLFRIQLLGLAGNPLPHDVTSIYNETDGTRKLLNYLLDHLSFTDVQAPPARTWIGVSHLVDDHRSALCELTVMCYNVLCDKYATRQMYGYCPNWALMWNYRRKGIMHEIRLSQADIISLQEVETDQFYNFFLPELKKDGYDGIFSPKSRAKTMSENDRKYVDGCAIFYRASKLKLIQERLVEFNQLAMANAEGSDDMLNRVMTKDNIGLAALFHTLEGAWSSPTAEPHQPLLVCTAHIHWDPEYCDVKLIQTMMLMHELRRIAEDTVRKLRPGRGGTPDVNSLPLLLCGDLNSLPDSGVIEFLLNGGISPNHPDFKELAYRTCLQKLSSSNAPNLLTHPFKMECAYPDDVMPYTNYTFDFKGIIDYIFYSKQHLRLLSLLGPVDMEWLSRAKVVGCPHPHIPSDHFSLVVKLQLISTMFQSPPNNGLLRR